MIRTALLALFAASAIAFAQDGWIPLFNGKDLTGWKVSENEATFKVVDGAIVANGPRGHCFYVGDVRNHDFKDFELKVDVKAAPGSNGGIYFHTGYQDSGWPAKGFEVQVNNSYAGDKVRTGSLYHVKDITEQLAGDDQWFTEHIVVKGDSVTVSVNGKEAVRWTQPAGWNGSPDFIQRRIASGSIALQGHDPKSTVAYKNILIRPLP